MTEDTRPEPPPDPLAPEAPRRSALKRFLPLIVVALGAGLGWWLLGDRLTFETLRENREALIAWRDESYALVAAAYMLAYVAVVAFSLPGALAMTLAGGFLFGLWPGALMIVASATAGATLIFLAAKTSLGDRLAKALEGRGGAMARFRRGIEENEIWFLLLIRLVPVMPFFVANLAPAFLGVGLRNYVLTTFFGIMPGTVVYTWVGAGLGEVFERGGTPDLGIIFEPHVLGPLLGLSALAALPMIVKAVRGRRPGEAPGEAPGKAKEDAA
ncbi:MAG: TVP38/TMEM64 family protein [Paracoccaceae bacterium]